MSTASKRTKKKRGVTRRVRDAQGNIIVKRYARRGRRFSIPGLKFRHLPQIIIGSVIMTYGYVANLHKTGKLAESESDLGVYLQYTFDQYSGFAAFLLAGSFAVVVSALFGYAIFTKGIKIKRWGGAFRQLIAVAMVVIIFTSLMSPFLNDIPTRQLDELIDVDGNYDLTGLESPFYSEFLEGLLDMLGNIPDPSLIVANISSADGIPLDPSVDRYLWRWTVADTYDNEKNDFIAGYPDKELDYIDSSVNPALVPSSMRAFNVHEQFLTITSSYSGTMLTPWHSELGAQIAPVDTYTYSPIPSTIDVYDEFTKGIRDINEQPSTTFQMSDSGAAGSVNYDTFWSEEDKESIVSKSLLLGQMGDALNAAPADRFEEFNNNDDITDIWGEGSLAGNSANQYVKNDPFGGFTQTWLAINSTINENTTAYDLAFQIYNQVSTQMIVDLFDGRLDISSTDSVSLAGETDKAYYYYQALNTQQSYGVKDLLVGLVNMLRAFNIPARLALGFSVGNFQNDGTIQMTMGNIHSWVEALVPWIEGTDVHYSWGIFNPIPDPYIFAKSQELVYGRNALGGAPNLNLTLTSGAIQTIPNGDNINGEDTFNVFNFNAAVDGEVDVDFDGIPAANQKVSLSLLDESILDDNGDVDIASLDFTNLGTDLGFVTTDATGTANFQFNTTRDGNIYRNYANGTVANITGLTGATINKISPLGSIGDYNIYVIMALYGLTYSIVVLGWTDNSLLEMLMSPPQYTVNDGIEDVNAGVVIPSEEFKVTVTMTDSTSGNPVAGETTIQLLIMDSNTFTTLQADFDSGTIDPSSLSQYQERSFPSTDVNGESSVFYNFDFTDAVDDVYAVVAYLEDTEAFAQQFIYLTDEVILGLDSFAISGADNKIDTSSGEIFTLVLNSTELVGTTSTLRGFVPRQAENISLSYYAIEKDLYDSTYFGQPYATLEAFINSASCVEAPALESCFFFNPLNPNTAFNVTAGFQTGTTGLTTATLNINNLAFPVNDYVIVIVNSDLGIFDNSTRFLILSPPAMVWDMDSSLQSLEISEDFQMVDKNSEVSIIENSNYFLLLGGLIVSRRFIK